ncbi:putative transmembrane protein [Paraburkholderia piptadeniae]|uniref:Transmembrane protein n=1 Tax=Paraburkholderia piptadeniae TaxID=1701573 RepID=A0A1N7SVM5_9BURK|nr:putative transmembrane protein [Paraburkholderia piptadeniae]
MKSSSQQYVRVSGPMLTKSWRWALYALVTLLVATGFAWLIVHYGRSDDALPSPMEPWSMKIHGATAMGAIFAVGAMLQRHLLPGWRIARNRAAGVGMCITLGLLTVTGYGLYYFDGDALRRAAEWLHWCAGCALPVVLAIHVAAARLSRRRASSRCRAS